MDFKELQNILDMVGVMLDSEIIDSPIVSKEVAEDYYLSLMDEYKNITNVRMLLSWRNVDVRILDEQIEKYAMVLSILEKYVYNDTFEQHIKALLLIQQHKNKTLGKKEQKELLDGIREIYDRTIPSPSSINSRGLSKWLEFIQYRIDDINEDSKLDGFYFDYIYNMNEENKWCDLIITEPIF